MKIDTVRLTDLADPQFSSEVTAMRGAVAAMAEGLDYAPDAMRAQAVAEVGLDDFGGTEYEEPLDVIAAAVDGSEILSPVGRFMMHAQLLQLLKKIFSQRIRCQTITLLFFYLIFPQ